MIIVNEVCIEIDYKLINILNVNMLMVFVGKLFIDMDIILDDIDDDVNVDEMKGYFVGKLLIILNIENKINKVVVLFEKK